MDAEPEKKTTEMMKSPKPKWRRAVVATSVLGGMLFSGVAILPTAVMTSSYRDTLLNAACSKHGLTASSAGGSGGWLTPVAFNQISLSDESGQIRCTIRQIHTSKTLLSMLIGDDDLGTITVIEPDLQLTLDEDGNLPQTSRNQPHEPETRSVAFEIVDGRFRYDDPTRRLPIVDLGNLDISGAVTNEEDGRWLTLQPIQLLDHQPLSEADAEQNLALIAPVLSQATAMSGEASVLVHAARIRLDGDDTSPFPIRGEAVFHTVQARLKSEWAAQITQLVGQAAGTAIPTRLEIARDSGVVFEVDAVGVHHKGLAFLLPEVTHDMRIESSGLVGHDYSLDLGLRIHLPLVAPQSPLLALISKITLAPINLQVKGTVSAPKLIGPPILDELSKRIAPGQHTQQPQDVTSAVMSLIGSAATPDKTQATENLPGGILGLIRSIKKAREDAPPKETPARRPKKRQRTQI